MSLRFNDIQTMNVETTFTDLIILNKRSQVCFSVFHMKMCLVWFLRIKNIETQTLHVCRN